MRTRFKTDTATIVVFDPARMLHRLDDDADWWSISRDEVAEINQGNALFVSVGADGVYDLEVVPRPPSEGVKHVEALIRNDSGRLFLGAGEYMTSGGMGPEAQYGNVFIDCPPGVYKVVVWMTGTTVFVHLTPSTDAAANAFTASPRVA
jgi:hypothetical protein